MGICTSEKWRLISTIWSRLFEYLTLNVDAVAILQVWCRLAFYYSLLLELGVQTTDSKCVFHCTFGTPDSQCIFSTYLESVLWTTDSKYRFTFQNIISSFLSISSHFQTLNPHFSPFRFHPCSSWLRSLRHTHLVFSTTLGLSLSPDKSLPLISKMTHGSSSLSPSLPPVSPLLHYHYHNQVPLATNLST